MHLLGIDTGGTSTDAVVYDEASKTVVAWAKAPTTHHNLAIGIDAATASVMANPAVGPIVMTSISTTLATNALVEDKGRNAGLVAIGFDQGSLDRVTATVDGATVVAIDGGHRADGTEQVPLDLAELASRTVQLEELDAIAVCSVFSVRNPSHELQVQEFLRAELGLPVTCTHELSSRLDGPRRALTAVLNARLLPLIDELLNATNVALRAAGIDAPLLVVRGDGALVSADYVRARPIETILSGPAASLVGASHLAALNDAVVADVGGTTTDIAILRDGRPVRNLDGAVVGGHRTMIDTVAMFTHGMGGDAEVVVHANGADITIGPQRVIPVCRLADSHPNMVIDALERQLASEPPRPLDAIFVVAADPQTLAVDIASMTAAEARICKPLIDGPRPFDEVAFSRLDEITIERLVRRRIVQVSRVTPTDASHVLGFESHHHRVAAELALAAMARQPTTVARPRATDAAAMAHHIHSAMVQRQARAVLGAAFDADGIPPEAVESPIVDLALKRLEGASRVDVGVSLTIVGVGAAAGSYFGGAAGAAAAIAADLVLPEHRGVANAVGTVVGRVEMDMEVVVSTPRRGTFVVHADTDQLRLNDLNEAIEAARNAAVIAITNEMEAAGATEISVSTLWTATTAEIEGRQLFVEGIMSASASGRPRLRGDPRP